MRTLAPRALAFIALLSIAGSAFAQSSLSSSQQPKKGSETRPAAPSGDPLEFVMMTTSKGPIVLELNRTKAPASVENFLGYAEEGFYDGTIFHRVIPTFMVQGGGFEPGMKKKTTRQGIPNEWKNGLKNTRGTVAMARLGGKPDSATSQFFINVVDNPFLDRPQPDGAGYAVFGRVLAGMKTVEAIRMTPTSVSGRFRDVPTEPITIQSVVRISAEEAKQHMEAMKKKDEGEATTKPN